VVVTLRIFDVSTAKITDALRLMATTRDKKRRFPGATFTKLLGTSSAKTFAPKDANWHRWAVLNVWSNTEAAERSQKLSSFAKWQTIAISTAELWLEPISVKGSWGGVNPFAGSVRSAQSLSTNASADAHQHQTPPKIQTPPGNQTTPQKWGGPTVALTRARIRPSKWLEFWRSSPPVARELQHSPGLITAMGIGEAPIGLQGTLSIWRSNKDLTGFVQRGQSHLQAIDSANTRSWYVEDLFARFALVAATGHVANIDLSSLRLPSSP
jgi:hypothetical protein